MHPFSAFGARASASPPRGRSVLSERAQTVSEISRDYKHTVMPSSTMHVSGEPVGDGDGDGAGEGDGFGVGVGAGVGDGAGPGWVVVDDGDGRGPGCVLGDGPVGAGVGLPDVAGCPGPGETRATATGGPVR